MVCEVVEVIGGGVVSTRTLPPRTTGPLPHGSVAVTRPKTHETLQLKGTVLDIVPLSDDDRAAMTAYQDSFVDELAQIGYRTEFTRTLLAGSEDCVAVVFEPTEMFNQTPGPKAGEKLGTQS